MNRRQYLSTGHRIPALAFIIWVLIASALALDDQTDSSPHSADGGSQLTLNVPDPSFESAETAYVNSQNNVDEALKLLAKIRRKVGDSKSSDTTLGYSLEGYVNNFFKKIMPDSYEDKEAYADHIYGDPTKSADEQSPSFPSSDKLSELSKEAKSKQEKVVDESSSLLAKAIKLLMDAANHNNSDALYLLADMNFYGNYTHSRNYTTALNYYKRLADLTGNSTSYNVLGFMYATGMFGDTVRDQAKSLLYHSFAALGGNTRSQMTLGYRYHSGIGTPRNCDKAVVYYKAVADKAMDYWRTGPAGGRTLDRHTWRLADDEGGVFGEGASESSSGINAKKKFDAPSDSSSFVDILEYLRYMADNSDIGALYTLARLYYDGTRALSRNHVKALYYFNEVTSQYWTKEGSILSDAPKSSQSYAGKAAGYLGRAYLRGEGTDVDYKNALRWYKLGVSLGDVASLNGYGYMHLKGLGGVKQNTSKAAEYFRGAADQNFGPAQVNIGKLFLEQGEVTISAHYFELAARHGHIEAFYYLAEMYNRGLGRDRSCSLAAAYYKIVTEKVEELQSPLEWAHKKFDTGDYESAIVGFMMAGEQGYESGQSNVAFLLDRNKSAFSFSDALKWILDYFQFDMSDDTEEARKIEELDHLIDEVALIYWTRSSKQLNIDSTVKIGDYYLNGIGSELDNEKAAACYQTAAEYQQSALALWNLGWMHENGMGVEQDFHLAKRFYDLALTTNSEAYLPVTLSLFKLRLRSYWNSISGGSVNGIIDPIYEEHEKPVHKWSFMEFWKKWFENSDDRVYEYDDDQQGRTGVTDGPDETGGNYQI
ncbi:hypothetical protein V1514DRAFT_326037 [Lipomyces japonicus]|uniref:uncharacterized protein n=1 Tax=Lipomyces japonicus TaxID=56871 RepID=UPI0034CEA734